MARSNHVRLIFPHQLFLTHIEADKETVMLLIEDDLFFKQYPFHKQKLILHRASMRHFADLLKKKGYQVQIIESSVKKTKISLRDTLQALSTKEISYYDLVDDWLQQAIDEIATTLDISVQRLVSPGFLTSPGQIDDYFDTNPKRMQYFYEWQRKRLNILVNDNKPVGGKWSYDIENRKKLPKTIQLPATYPKYQSKHVKDAQIWVKESFPKNPGNHQTFHYPVTHDQAKDWLQHFISERLTNFGPYEDAISHTQSQLFHSVLSPLLNSGLLTPQNVVDEALAFADKQAVPIESLEGFIRQIIGWREYMRATYVRYGRVMRTQNHLHFKSTLSKGWWDGSVGIEPIDTTIKRVLETGYAHHIERLMVLGNSMVLLRIHPDEVYKWFMSLFIDAYDWVMVPNVYAMSQFAAGDMITTKPYISGSNYLIKMSDYKKGDWSDIWDALYWQFITDHRELVESNYRMRMVVNVYQRFDDDKKKQLKQTADQWLDIS